MFGKKILSNKTNFHCNRLNQKREVFGTLLMYFFKLTYAVMIFKIHFG